MTSRWSSPDSDNSGIDAGVKRRNFIAAAAGAFAGFKAGSALAQAVRTSRLGPIGLQLYTLRRMMERSAARTLAAVARAGYREVEFAGYFNTPVPAIRRLLDDNGLTSPSAHITMADIGMMWEVILEQANQLGQKYLTVAWIDAHERTLDGYKRIADRFNAAGARARQEGVQLAFHNHSYGFAPIGGRVPYEILLRETEPANLVMEADIFWMRDAKQDPLAWFAKYPGRFHLLHVKDMGPPPKNQMMDVGKGVIDWRSILSRSKQAGVRHVFVEHDDPKDPLTSIRNSVRYLKGLTYPS
jgi:sugar phosphate isomerase/epimerase